MNQLRAIAVSANDCRALKELCPNDDFVRAFEEICGYVAIACADEQPQAAEQKRLNPGAIRERLDREIKVFEAADRALGDLEHFEALERGALLLAGYDEKAPKPMVPAAAEAWLGDPTMTYERLRPLVSRWRDLLEAARQCLTENRTSGHAIPTGIALIADLFKRYSPKGVPIPPGDSHTQSIPFNAALQGHAFTAVEILLRTIEYRPKNPGRTPEGGREVGKVSDETITDWLNKHRNAQRRAEAAGVM